MHGGGSRLPTSADISIDTRKDRREHKSIARVFHVFDLKPNVVHLCEVVLLVFTAGPCIPRWGEDCCKRSCVISGNLEEPRHQQHCIHTGTDVAIKGYLVLVNHAVVPSLLDSCGRVTQRLGHSRGQETADGAVTVTECHPAVALCLDLGWL